MTVQVLGLAVGATDVVALPGRVRLYLGIFNQSTTATISVAFDAPAVAAATAGQITLLPVNGANKSSIEFTGLECPNGVVHLISSAAGAPVTVIG